MPTTSAHEVPAFRRILRFIAVAAWAGVIYLASDQPDLRVSDDDLLDFVLRKLAHLAVFGILLLLAAHALAGVRWNPRMSLVGAWCVTFAWAVSDEWHQTFVEGRAGQPRDVAIDMLGATAAAAMLVTYRRRQETR